MSSKDSLVLELFKDNAITYSTIDSLLKYGFDSNESLLSLEFDLDFPQMPDICLSQKCLLRNRLIDLRKKFNNKSEDMNNWGSDHCLEDYIKAEDSADDCHENCQPKTGRNSSAIFTESEAIVREMKDQVLQQMNESQSLPKNLISIEFSFEPIVDHLRECLIRVEKQKHEKDLIIERQKIELRVKELEIQKLEAQKKQLETQLVCEKLKVDKLDYKLKSVHNRTNCDNHKKRVNQVNHHNFNGNKFLDDLKAIYYDNNTNLTNDWDCGPTRSETAEDHSSRRSSESSMISEYKSNFINLWTEVETDSTNNKTNKNLNEVKTSLFAKYVAKHTKNSNGVNNDGDESLSDPIKASDEDSLLDMPSLPSSDPCSQTQDSLEPPQKWKTSAERKLYEPELEAISSDSDSSPVGVESIVCEPDFDWNPNYFSYKTKSHLKVENNRVVINTLGEKPVIGSRRISPKTSNLTKLRAKKSSQSLLSKTKSNKQSLLKAFRCHYQNCSLSFVSAEGLKRHVRSIHTKERPFECHFGDCRKRFGRSDALKEHLKRHMGLKLYECSYTNCDFKSVSSNSLKRHVFSIHLKEKHFKCLYEKCNKTFGRKDSLKKHMEKQHSICDNI